MSHTTIANRTRLFSAATAIAAVGLLTVAAPAHASPPSPTCSQYVFNGDFAMRQDNGFQTFFTSAGPTAGGRVVSVNDDNVTKLTGVVSGGIWGRHVDLTIHWDNAAPVNYSANVGDDGYAHGSTGNGINWDATLRPLDCSDPAASPPPPPLRIPESDSLTVAPPPPPLRIPESDSLTVAPR
jgi:hypothetical protein